MAPPLELSRPPRIKLFETDEFAYGGLSLC